ncbi:Hypothetical predicted protein, partial [Pelobates cultripes]
ALPVPISQQDFKTLGKANEEHKPFPPLISKLSYYSTMYLRHILISPPSILYYPIHCYRKCTSHTKPHSIIANYSMTWLRAQYAFLTSDKQEGKPGHPLGLHNRAYQEEPEQDKPPSPTPLLQHGDDQCCVH